MYFWKHLFCLRLTLKQFTCVKDTKEVLVFSDSCWFLSRLLVSLPLELPNQFNSCSCHSSHHQHYIFGLCWQNRNGNWEHSKLVQPLPSHSRESCPELPRARAGQVPPATQIHTSMCYWCIHLSWCCSVSAQNASVELSKYGSCTTKVFIINLIINLHNWFPSWQQAGQNK